MAKILLIEGPVGAGKSTFAAKLSKELAAPSLRLDAWCSSGRTARIVLPEV